jgi:hypothetical protein
MRMFYMRSNPNITENCSHSSEATAVRVKNKEGIFTHHREYLGDNNAYTLDWTNTINREFLM